MASTLHQTTSQPRINPPDPAKLVARVTQVSSLPEIYLKVEQALANPMCSSRMLGDIVSEDPALSARILRLANSSYFSFPGKVDTISQAITLIGTRQLQEIVLASSIVAVFKDIPEEVVDMDAFWRHSITCGLGCRIIATQRREANVETAFISGLLHDIGRLVLFKALPGPMGELIQYARDSQQLLYKVEKEYLGFDHGKLGGLLLDAWKLPKHLANASRYHHNPMACRDHSTDVATVHIADIIANALQNGSSGERLVPTINDQAWQTLGLGPENIAPMIDELDRQYHVAVDFVLGNG